MQYCIQFCKDLLVVSNHGETPSVQNVYLSVKVIPLLTLWVASGVSLNIFLTIEENEHFHFHTLICDINKLKFPHFCMRFLTESP